MAPEETTGAARARAEAVRARCVSSVSHQGPRAEAPRRVLERLLATTPEGLEPDCYGEGKVLDELEREVALLLGKEAAVFMPSGTMAQPIALRIAADRHGSRHVGFHPLCHLEVHEEKGYQLLHGLHGVWVGKAELPMTPEDLAAVKEPLAALLVELPQRDLGGTLPTWEELVVLTSAARARGAHVHLDGARLWESAPFYGRPYAEIAGLFDSAYVSFYKALGGIAGAALAGTAELVAEARIWQRRQGGNLVALWPYAIAARAALERALPRVPLYVEKARRIAAALAAVPGVVVTPSPPPTNMMHLYLRGDRAALERAAVDVAEESGVWLFRRIKASRVPSTWLVEISIGESALDLEDARVAELFAEVLRRAAV